MRTHLRARCGDGRSEDTRIVKFRQVALLLATIFTAFLVSWTGAAAEEGRTPDESLRLAQSAAAAGDVEGAREIVTEAFGADVFAVPGARPPRVTQALLRVGNAAGERQLSVTFIDADRGQSAAAVARETVAALAPRAPVVVAGPALTITLRYDNPAGLLAAQDRLAAALPDLPELALLMAALSSRSLDWTLTEGLLTRERGYMERVDLGPAVRTWDAEAEKLERAAAGAEVTGQPLDQVRAAVWRSDARLWRDMGALSRAVYTVRVDEQGDGPEWIVSRVRQVYTEGSLQREWTVRPGETRQLEASILGWRYDRLALAAVAAALLVVVVFVTAALIVR